MSNQCCPQEAIEHYAGAIYKQHNPGVLDGKEAGMEELRKGLAAHKEQGNKAWTLALFIPNFVAVQNLLNVLRSSLRISSSSIFFVSTMTAR